MSEPTDCTEPGCIAPAAYRTRATDDDWPTTEGWCEVHYPGRREAVSEIEIERDAELARLRAALVHRDAWIAGAVEALQALEWSVELGHGLRSCPACPLCFGWASEGHIPCCRLKEALSTGPETIP